MTDLMTKQAEFEKAAVLYATHPFYRILGPLVSIINCSLQLILLVLVLPFSIGPFRQAIVFAFAYFITDFLNGLVHMYMDNNQNYSGWTGPLAAAFHLHHQKPVYRRRNIINVYFTETGSKIWLVFFLLLSVCLAAFALIPPEAAYLLLYISVLSSAAEVAHYLCHVQNGRLPSVFRGCGLLLSKRYHVKHHKGDNRQYAFLNGMSDFLINRIAKRFVPGYKNFTDLHYLNYDGPQTGNRKT